MELEIFVPHDEFEKQNIQALADYLDNAYLAN